MQLGKRQALKVNRKKDFGIYLVDTVEETDGISVLLPKSQVPEGIDVGDEVEVFLYKDSEDRLIATRKSTKIELDKIARLVVKELTNIGAFVDIGIDKDILLPFKEMEGSVQVGDEVLMAMYEDRSHRLALTMRIYKYLSTNHNLKKDDEVEATVYRIRNIGVMLAVSNQYYGMIPKSEVFSKYKVGDRIKGRVVRVRDDGKLDISARKKAYMQMDRDVDIITKRLEECDGILYLSDSSSPELIREKLGMSKAAFKRATGRMYKQGLISITSEYIKYKSVL